MSPRGPRSDVITHRLSRRLYLLHLPQGCHCPRAGEMTADGIRAQRDKGRLWHPGLLALWHGPVPAWDGVQLRGPHRLGEHWPPDWAHGHTTDTRGCTGTDPPLSPNPDSTSNPPGDIDIETDAQTVWTHRHSYHWPPSQHPSWSSSDHRDLMCFFSQSYWIFFFVCFLISFCSSK